jgi:general secretion pathway protein D
VGNLAGLAGLAGGQQQQGQQGAAGLAGLAGLGGGFAGGIPRQEVGTTIRLTPHINEQDEIRLEIEEEISEAGPPAQQGNVGVRSIERRTATTELMVRDQQTVVIGGLMRDTVSTSERKIPILGDIPLIGALFRQSTKTKQKRNLLLFLTPYIIQDPSDLRAIFERKMRERQEFIDRYFVFGDHEYEPPIDYTRTRGLVLEILNEIDAIQEERELMEAAASEPVPEHTPRPPVGSAADLGVGEDDEGESDEEDLIIEPDDGGGDEAPEQEEE